MSNTYNYCHVAQLTDVGCKRKANEDWMASFKSPNGLVAVVCDGMGGHVGGQVASHTAVEAIERYMMQQRDESPRELIVNAVNAANTAILNRAAIQPELTGMGSTCVMLLVRDDKVYIGSVGDSRVYLIRNHRIKQLTVDQSYVQMLVDAGSITPDEAERHPRKNEITNALGLPNMQPATVLPQPISPEAGDCFLLCSDGLSGMVANDEICNIVSKQSQMSQQQRVEELVERAKQNGGLDNITCQIVEFAITPGDEKNTSWLKRNLWPTIGICAAVVLAVIVAAIYPWDNDDDDSKEAVENLVGTADSIISIDKPIKFVKNATFMTIVENKDFGGAKIIIKQADIDTIFVLKSIAIKSMSVSDTLHYRPYRSNDTTMVSFGKEYGGSEFAIRLNKNKDDDISYAIMCKINDANARSEEKIGNTSGTNTPLDLDTAKLGSIFTEKKPQLEYTIKLNGDSARQTVTLYAKEGTNTDTKIYFKNRAFSTVYKAPDPWWEIENNNGSECRLLIHTADIPKEKATIKIPTTKNDTITLHVKLREKARGENNEQGSGETVYNA